MFRSILSIVCLALVFSACSPDESPIVSERKQLAKKLERMDVVLYKTLKLGARGAVDIGIENLSIPEPSELIDSLSVENMLEVRNTVAQVRDSIEFSQVIRIATTQKDWVLETHEDDYPTLFERAQGDQLLHLADSELPIHWTASHEHLMLTVAHILAKRDVNPLSLYEAELIDEHEFDEDDWAIITHLLTGTQYFLFEWPYLAELEFTRGIDHVEQTNLQLKFIEGNDQQIMQDAYHALFLIFRSFARMSMEDEDKLEEAKEDIMKASLLLEKNTEQELLSGLIAAQNALENDRPEKALKELARAKSDPSAGSSINNDIDDVVGLIQTEEFYQAKEDLQDLIASRQVIVTSLGQLLESTGITEQIGNTEAGKRYRTLREKAEKISSTFDGLNTAEEIINKGKSLFQKEN